MEILNKKKIKKIAIVGVGYVGLPLALELHRHFKISCYDFSLSRVEQLNKGIDENNENNLKKINKKNISFSNQKKILKNNDIFIICVPTPILKNNKPDLKMTINASALVSKYIKSKSIVIYESTFYPGLTEEICLPILQKKSGMKINKDFYIGYSPERINPADKKHNLKNIVKIISASDKKALNIIDYVYSKICKSGLHKANSIKIAEGSKIIENIQRDINIALMNELSIVFDKLNIPFQDVLKAAKTKWNFLDFSPGLVGGHCIGVDPYYLTYKSKRVNYIPKVILSGRKINDNMHFIIYKKIINECKKNKIDPEKSSVIQLGITFKENCSDFRNSKSIELYQLLKSSFKKVDLYDPIVNSTKLLEKENIKLLNTSLTRKYDFVIISVLHNLFNSEIDFKKIIKTNSQIFSIKPLNNKSIKQNKILYL